jgi:hypothetical protein
MLLGLPIGASQARDEVILSLKGTIHTVGSTPDAMTFLFTGLVSFPFSTAQRNDPNGKEIYLAFSVKDLLIRIQKFTTTEYESEDCPSGVTFKNAVQNAWEAVRSHDSVTVTMAEPVLFYDASGVIKRIEAQGAAQVWTARLDRDFRTGRIKPECFKH